MLWASHHLITHLHLVCSPTPYLNARSSFSPCSWNATMKHHSSDHSLWVLRTLLLLVITFLFLRTSTASRLLPPTPPAGRDSDKVAGFLQASQVGEEEREDTWDLMGMEVCEDGNEECLKRRVISEAHLDYIYTQRHHKP
ncbi:putative phytosulfokines 6 isoform X2 [Ananas comosus]|uniref:Phytosulfokine n=1 Tax=Ananas comosus TaxID=4615 RepID=A0A6P5H0U6_ANACO|nr:putative phytosulfokines 6 isoform X2 [Ananas comosus]